MTKWKVSFPMSEKGNTERLLFSLGLCQKAGKTICGVPMICEAMRKGGAKSPLIVLEALDTSENTHKRLTDKCKYYSIRHVRISCTVDTLANALGKSAQLGAVAVTDEGLCRLIEKYI